MINKNGVVPYQIIVGIIVLAIFVPFLVATMKSVSCTDEKNKIDNLNNEIVGLNNQLVSYQGQINNLEEQLREKENLSNQLEDCKTNLGDLQEKLNNCQSLKDSFFIFGIINVHLTKAWILLLNISLGISIISIFNILHWIFKKPRKK